MQRRGPGDAPVTDADAAAGREPGAYASLRLARPTGDLAAARRFWVDGLGLEVLWESPAGSGHALAMVGWPTASWHLELVHDPAVTPKADARDLLVLYLGGPVAPSAVERLVAAGGRRVPSRNTYWDEWGVTIADPDGYRLVLSTRGWQS